jgi:hypothetical protein
MRTRTWLPAVIALSFHITGCMSASARQRSASVRPTVISAEELRGSDASNVYDAIVRLRPAFFATRGSTSILAEPSEPIVVIINRSIRGGVNELRDIEASNVRSIRRLTAAEVFSITGRSAPSGGIEVLVGP